LFKKFTPERCIAIQIEAIDLTIRYAARGVAVSIAKSAFDSVGAHDLWSTPYSFMCGQVLYGVRDWASENGFEGEVEYIFEAGADGQVKAVEETTRALLSEATVYDFRYGRHRHGTKTEDVQLQSADLLAWHWFTHMKRVQRGDLKPRRDFRRLIERRIDPHHYERDSIERWKHALNEGQQAAVRVRDQPRHVLYSQETMREALSKKNLAV
jgi:hypothetical protein